MAQALPIIIQLLNNPTFVKNVNDAHWQFDAVAIFKAFTDAAGWKFSQDFLREMNPDEVKRYEQNSPAALQAAQAKSAQAASQQKFQQDQQIEDQKQLGKAGAEVLRSATEHSLSSEDTGVPGNQGFGSEVSV
jgi:hypothetical protein